MVSSSPHAYFNSQLHGHNPQPREYDPLPCEYPVDSHLSEQAFRHSPQAPHAPQFELSPDILAAITQALGRDVPAVTTTQDVQPPARKYFSKAITNTTSELPMSVIKELKAGFKNYIPLALCTHKACQYATRSTDPIDTEIGWTEKGEMRLKQRSMNAAKDYNLSTNDFTEIRENFIRGIRKYLVMGDDDGPGGDRAMACADMFRDFFSIIAARSDYTQDWLFYRRYIIESYTSWVGRRDDSYGIIFDEHDFYKHRVGNLVPAIMEQLKQSAGSNSGANGNRGGSGNSGFRGRGHGFQSSGTFGTNRGGYQGQGSFQSQQSSNTFRCYLCGGSHSHKEHQGTATRLVTNEQGKWIDKAHGNKIVCISFNISPAGCRRGTTCNYSHSCSLCGDLSHGCAKCPG